MADIKIDDDGFVNLTIGGETKTIDLYTAFERLNAIARDVEEKPAADYFVGVQAYISELGFPPVSNRAADKFATAIFDTVNVLKKKDGGTPTPESPESTEPRP